MAAIIEALRLDMTRQRKSLLQQWQLAEVRVVTVARLYERLGFRVTHEDQHKLCMRREWSPARHESRG